MSNYLPYLIIFTALIAACIGGGIGHALRRREDAARIAALELLRDVLLEDSDPYDLALKAELDELILAAQARSHDE